MSMTADRTGSDAWAGGVSGEGDFVELGGVLAGHPARLCLRDIGEMFLDILLRGRPRAVHMWIVTGPEDVIDSDNVAIADPDNIIDEGPKDLPVNIEARLFDQI